MNWPPIPGAPWWPEPEPQADQPVAAVPAPVQDASPERQPDFLPDSPFFYISNVPAPQPIIPAPAHAAPAILPKRLPFISRVPNETETRRLARITERLTIVVNSLMAQGYIIQTGQAAFKIKAGSSSGLTGTFP